MSPLTTISPESAQQAAQLGAQYVGEGRTSFRVWAPDAERVSVDIYSPRRRTAPLQPSDSGHWTVVLDDVAPGALYKYNLGGDRVFPDPASQAQPEGVHGASMVVAPEFPWTDSSWRGMPLEEYVLYEIHPGAFTSEGTFDAAIGLLPYLKDLGITAIEVMPVAQFPGSRNWGYDGVYPYAVQDSYGGPAAFKRFIDAAHHRGLAVVLDVVYNHLGPEGNYIGQFGPYFTSRYRTPWGSAVNFDGADAAGVREYVIQNALHWVRDFHVDGLRLDAVHAIFDSSPVHILTDLAAHVHELAERQGRTIAVIAESDLNEARIVRPREQGGYGLDAQWSDDFHHAVHTVLTGELMGYYEDFGRVEDLEKALAGGFVYSGQPSKHRGRPHGTDSGANPGSSFVVFVQNHDQIGNRMLGERLHHLVDVDRHKTAAALLLLSPYVPLIFMGEEYAEAAPFLYFVDHSDPGLIAAVRQGRRDEFASFAWKGEVPDPQDAGTFSRSRLNHNLRDEPQHASMLEWYRSLIQLRKSHPALQALDRGRTAVELLSEGSALVLRRWKGDKEVLALFSLGNAPAIIGVEVRQPNWTVLLNSRSPASEVREPLEAGSGRLRVQLEPFQCVILDSSLDSHHTI